MNISEAAREAYRLLQRTPSMSMPEAIQRGIDTATAALTLELETVRQQLAEAREDSSQDKPLPEDEAIEAAHPINSGLHDLYGEAMRLVGAKHTKAALVALVNWLLTERMERDRTIKRLSRTLNPPTDEK